MAGALQDPTLELHNSDGALLASNDNWRDTQETEIIASTVGKENTYGTIVGRMKSGAFTFGRVSTDDTSGRIRAYVGEGELTNDLLNTFGGFGVVRIERLQDLLRYVCENGFEHHVAFNLSSVADAVREAMEKYMGWSVYRHA